MVAPISLEFHQLHGAFLPIGFGFAQRDVRLDDEVFDVAAVNARADFGEARLPIFAFPAMAGVGIDAEAFVAIAGVHEHIEVVSAHGGGAGMNFVGKDNPL